MKFSDLDPQNEDERVLAKFMVRTDRFTHADLNDLGVNAWKKDNFLSRLRQKHVLRRVQQDKSKAVFTVLDEEAAIKFEQAKRQTPPGAMWTTMRVLKEFTPEDILATVSDSFPSLAVAQVKTYCRHLLNGQYLLVVQKARTGGRSARYRLIRDTGPMAPKIQRLKCVVDGNTDRAVYVQGGRQ